MKTVPTIAELYQDPEVLSRAKAWRDIYYGRPETLLETTGLLRHISVPSALLEQLEAQAAGAKARQAAVSLLGGLPTKNLVGYGKEVTAWVFGNDFPERAKTHASKLDQYGLDGEMLLGAANLSRLKTNLAPKSSEVLAHYAVMGSITGNGLEEIDLPKLLQGSTLPGTNWSDKRATAYSLIALSAKTKEWMIDGKVYDWDGRDEVENPGLRYDMWLDTSVGFALAYKGHPQAMAGLKGNGGDEIMVSQLQGLRGLKFAEPKEPEGNSSQLVFAGYRSARGLAPLDWRKLMVGISGELGANLGFDSVGIVNGKEVADTYQRDISVADAQKAYDLQAQRLGFRLGEDNYWHRSLV